MARRKTTWKDRRREIVLLAGEDLLRRLSELERLVIGMRYHPETPCGPAAIARVLGMTRGRVVWLEGNALARLKDLMAEAGRSPRDHLLALVLDEERGF